MRGWALHKGDSAGHVLTGRCSLFPAPCGLSRYGKQGPRRTRSEDPREHLRSFSNRTMPPERRSRTRPDRRAGARPDRKTRMRPDDRAAGPDGPLQKAAPSFQRKSPARPRAAAAVVAAEEERRLRQRNRQTLEEDKPAVERCLEELVFGDVEDDEDALLRRLRGPWVREAATCGLGARWAVCLRGRSLGDLWRRGAFRWEGTGNAGAAGCQTESPGRAETAPFSAPEGAAEPGMQQALNTYSFS